MIALLKSIVVSTEPPLIASMALTSSVSLLTAIPFRSTVIALQVKKTKKEK